MGILQGQISQVRIIIGQSIISEIKKMLRLGES